MTLNSAWEVGDTGRSLPHWQAADPGPDHICPYQYFMKPGLKDESPNEY